MIEVQIKADELYNELKQYSNYHSDITHVCSFRDEMSELLESYGVEFEKNEEEKKENRKPTLTIQGRNIMRLNDCSAEMLHFVGVRSEFDPTIPIANMNRVTTLIENNLVDIDLKFSNLYSHLGYNSKINELVCSTVKFYGKGKLTDHIDGDLTIKNLNFTDIKETKINYRQMELKVLGPLDESGKTHDIHCKIQGTSTKKVTLKFYNKPIILKSIAFKGNNINIAAGKILEDRYHNYIIYDPVILPEGLEFSTELACSPKSRKIPADLWRNAYFEFMYRYSV